MKTKRLTTAICMMALAAGYAIVVALAVIGHTLAGAWEEGGE